MRTCLIILVLITSVSRGFAQSPQDEIIYHVVQPKETVYRMTVLYKVTAEEIRKWNNLPGNELQIGQKIIVGYKQPAVQNNIAVPEKITAPPPAASTVSLTKTPMSAKEVYDRYYEAVGGSKNKLFEQVKSFKNYQTSGCTSTYLNDSLISKAKAIAYYDPENKVSAGISCNLLTKEIGRSLTAQGKIYSYNSDGGITETPIKDFYSMFSKTLLEEQSEYSEGKKLLPNEVFNEEEVYVVYYESEIIKDMPGINYEYFSVKSGLKIGSKTLYENQTILTYSIGNKSIMISTSGLKGKETTVRTETVNHETLTNVDLETFKNGIFKNPEKALEAIPCE